MAKRSDLATLLQRIGSVTSDDLERAARERGWELHRVRGSHHIYRKAGWPGRISIPRGTKAIGTIRGIIHELAEEETHD